MKLNSAILVLAMTVTMSVGALESAPAPPKSPAFDLAAENELMLAKAAKFCSDVAFYFPVDFGLCYKPFMTAAEGKPQPLELLTPEQWQALEPKGKPP